MSIGIVVLTPVAVVLGYLSWQLVRKAGHWVSDHRRRDVSDGAPGHVPEAAGDTEAFGGRPTARLRVKTEADSDWELTVEPIGDSVTLASDDDALIEYVVPAFPDEPMITRDGVAEVIIYSDRAIVVYLPRFDEFRVTDKAGQVLIEVGTL
ncbi:hypothetical protein A3N97_03685 [Mycobacteroides abscessus]|uniref:hypothetical protein n=1 Tax=Mycobacteroides abscessus TaxID=36809 RepID=UPI00078CD6E1|nr:hypothetical protein [Mycobacteroides abscessus]AMU29791.1 hypothetical protein A3N97_03685 [Mycobacteroides abscessus]SKV58888.1 Uncharacterised protein [Mycobacteroides abscessus subsp. massiliense]